MKKFFILSLLAGMCLTSSGQTTLQSLAGTYNVPGIYSDGYNDEETTLTFTLTYDETAGTLTLTSLGDAGYQVKLQNNCTLDGNSLTIEQYLTDDYSTYAYYYDDSYNTNDVKVTVQEDGSLLFVTPFNVGTFTATYDMYMYDIAADAVATNSTTTAIRNTTATADSSKIFGIDGVRLGSEPSGKLFIQNGKKYIRR